MNRYDPEYEPNPEQWLALDEQERIDLAEEHHRIANIKLPNLQAHAALHAIVESQIAQNLESVVRAMTRLTAGGLSRHEAIRTAHSKELAWKLNYPLRVFLFICFYIFCETRLKLL